MYVPSDALLSVGSEADIPCNRQPDCQPCATPKFQGNTLAFESVRTYPHDTFVRGTSLTEANAVPYWWDVWPGSKHAQSLCRSDFSEQDCCEAVKPGSRILRDWVPDFS